jgi:hypothetical protein
MQIGHIFQPVDVLVAGTTSSYRQTKTLSVTTATRSGGTYCPALSTVCINISGTATVKIISNPFGVNAMDTVLTTVTVSGNYVVDSAAVIVVDVTAVTGTVSALVVFNGEVE